MGKVSRLKKHSINTALQQAFEQSKRKKEKKNQKSKKIEIWTKN